MKKIITFAVISAFALCSVEASDYVKMQVKEMKKAQKYGTTQKVVQNENNNTCQITVSSNLSIKDPKIMNFGDYKKINNTDFEAKIKKDNIEYKKYHNLMAKKVSKAYKTQADSDDYYKIYRVAEKIIRANNLDYINWRIAIIKDVDTPNAYTANTNYIAITTAMVDTFTDNENALAFIIGHEMGHALLGHQTRKKEIIEKLERNLRIRNALSGRYTNYNVYSTALTSTRYLRAGYSIQESRLLAESRKMELAADVEGAKLIFRAGYDLDKCMEALTYFDTFTTTNDHHSSHPNSQKRIANYNENRKYFPNEWKDIGKYNIYNSEVIPVQLSSDRNSMIITPPQSKLNPDKFYTPEKMNELFARLGYMYYVNGEFEKSLQYFGELFKIEQTNAPAYLYASYASEYLYKKTGNSKYLNLAKEYALTASNIDSKNKYIKEQVNNL